MKIKWISINDQMPILNEIIYYNGKNAFDAKHIGNEHVESQAGKRVRFNSWSPKHPGFVTFNIQHPDDGTILEAKGKVEEGLFIAEYQHNNIDWGIQIPLSKI